MQVKLLDYGVPSEMQPTGLRSPTTPSIGMSSLTAPGLT